MTFKQGTILLIESLGSIGHYSKYNKVVSETDECVKVKNLSPERKEWLELNRRAITNGLRHGDVTVKP